MITEKEFDEKIRIFKEYAKAAGFNTIVTENEDEIGCFKLVEFTHPNETPGYVCNAPKVYKNFYALSVFVDMNSNVPVEAQIGDRIPGCISRAVDIKIFDSNAECKARKLTCKILSASLIKARNICKELNFSEEK